jgi:hypothetical protein
LDGRKPIRALTFKALQEIIMATYLLINLSILEYLLKTIPVPAKVNTRKFGENNRENS